MKQKLCAFVVRRRTLLMALFFILSVLAGLTMGRVRVNYDLTSYLSEDTDTKKALTLMNGEFEETSSLSIVLVDADAETAAADAAWIAALDGVMTSVHDEAEGVREEAGHTYRLISVVMTEESAESVLDAVNGRLESREHLISGGAQDSRSLRESIAREIPIVMLVSCLIVLAVLLAMTRSWLEPLLFFLVIAVSVLLNMGTNWIFPSISFITFAVTAILQLALAMDYSIMLINAFDRLRASMDTRAAMRQALADSMMPIASSALTTVAGMLSLVFMSFRIGFDIGVVLAKGILLSMLTVFLFMPGLLTLCAPLLDKTAHKPLPISGRALSRVSHGFHGLLPVLLIALIAAGAALQGQSTYTYTVRDMSEEAREVSELFGQNNQIVLLFPKDESDEGIARQRDLIARVSAIEADGAPVVKEALSMVTTGEMALRQYEAADIAGLLGVTPEAAQTYLSLLGIETPIRGDALIARLDGAAQRLPFLPQTIRDQLAEAQSLLAQAQAAFNGQHYSRAILTLDLPMNSPYAHDVVKQIKAALHDVYGEDVGMAGMLAAMDDIATSFTADMMRVSFITIGLVFLIVALSFRSAVVPLLLVCVIQGAIWINMSASNLIDGSIFFMCYLICMALQMGATIDYGILLTSHYRTLRQTMDKRDAAAQAIQLSLQTILTSGLALIVAGFSVGIVSTVFYISSIGTMLGRGAVVSVLLVLFLLPKLLQWLDRWVVSTGKKERTNPSLSEPEREAERAVLSP